MKKRLLITSIVMMLVVAVALSTATYAWFTQNNKVDAQAVILTAATMEGDAILITHNANGSGASNQIILTAQGNDVLYPATPKANTSLTSFTSGIASIGSNFQNLIMDGSGKYSDPTISGTSKSCYTDTFYVFNKGYQARRLVPVVNIVYNDADNTAKMAAQSARIAIIERTPTAEVTLGSVITGTSDANMSAYKLKGIWQYNTAEGKDTAVTNYYDHPTAFSNTATYYTDEGTTTATGVTAETFASMKDTIYVEIEGTMHKNEAAKDGPALGSTNEASGYGVVAGTGANSGYYTQGAVAFTPEAFTSIPAATSGNHIANEYTVIVWLEGWDADCTNAITSGAFRVDLSFTAGA